MAWSALEVRARRTAELSEEDHQELRELSWRVHGPPEARRSSAVGRLTWAGIEDTVWSITARQGGLLVSSLFVGERVILLDGVERRAGTIRGVVTDPAHRRRGFGRAVMLLGQQYIWQAIGADLGILLSSEMAVPFYQSLGWRTFDGKVICEQPQGTIHYTDVISEGAPMLLLRDGDAMPTKEIDLRGFPF
jgi:GNAT superfamily N-acetyltransferase